MTINQILSGESIVAAAPGQVSSDLDGEAVILDMKSGQYYGLDNVGASIWQLIQSPISINEIRNNLLAEYDVEADQCEKDLLDLLVQLLVAGLIEVQDASGA